MERAFFVPFTRIITHLYILSFSITVAKRLSRFLKLVLKNTMPSLKNDDIIIIINEVVWIIVYRIVKESYMVVTQEIFSRVQSFRG